MGSQRRTSTASWCVSIGRGPDPFERAFLAGRHSEPERLDDPKPRLFVDGIPQQTGRRSSAKDAAALLLRQAHLLDHLAFHPTVEEATQAARKRWNGDEVEADRFWKGYFAEAEEAEDDLAFELLSRKRAAAGLTPKEQSFFDDLWWLRGVFSTLEGVPLARSREIAVDRFREHFGRAPSSPPPALTKELNLVRRKRRRREKKEATAFHRQLGNPDLDAALSQLPPNKQGQRIGEWRHAIKKDEAKRKSLLDADPDSA